MSPSSTIKKHQIIHGERLQRNRTIKGDVVIIGTGAGGGVTAEILAKKGLKVIMVEEGPYQTVDDFHMQEAEAYPELYREVANLKTKDKAITILQGRAVGGSTTVNWTSCFHIPEQSLNYWAERYGLKGFSISELAPWYAHMEKRLHITPWPGRNPSNEILYQGARSLKWHHAVIHRNVYRCRNLGYCGLGCPVDAKQSTLVTTIPAALDRGAVLLSRTRAERLKFNGDSVDHVQCVALDKLGTDPTGIRIRIEAKYVVLAGGGINSPALLMRSKAHDPYNRVGKRTFLHPTIVCTADMPHKIEAFYGAPQSVHSNQFLWRDGVAGKMGYKIEVAPLHPAMAATVFNAFGKSHAEIMTRIPYISPMIALMRDGFHEDSPGGNVSLRDDGSPELDYTLTDYLWEGVRHAYLSMAECQFAAGANHMMPVHLGARPYKSWSEARQEIRKLTFKPHHTNLSSAHVMGGCAMGEDPRQSVVNSLGQHHHIENLSIIDGSTFPTSVGANPSLPIYAMAAMQASFLAGRLSGFGRK